MYGKLFNWAQPRGLTDQPDLKSLTIYHDNPEITEEDKLRISACITVPEGTEDGGEIGLMTIPAGKYAIGHFEINVSEYKDA